METTVNVDNFGTAVLTDEQMKALQDQFAAEDKVVFQTAEDLGEPAEETVPPWETETATIN